VYEIYYLVKELLKEQRAEVSTYTLNPKPYVLHTEPLNFKA